MEEGAFGCSWIPAKLFRADVGPAGRRRTVHSTGCIQAVGTESPGDADCVAQPPPITPRTMSTPPAVGVVASSSAPFLNKSLKLLAMVANRRRPWPTPHHRMVGGCSPAGLRLTGVRSGLIKRVSQAPWPGLSAWVELGGIAPFPCPKSRFPHPIST